MHDVNLLDQLGLEVGAFYLMGRGYVGFARLHFFTQASAFFITRAKKNLQFNLLTSRPVVRSTSLRCDQTIPLADIRTSQQYPDVRRHIVYFDVKKEARLIFLTNILLSLLLPITRLYRARWQVELFFRRFKQPLHLKASYGTSVNGMKTQLWAVLSYSWQFSINN